MHQGAFRDAAARHCQDIMTVSSLLCKERQPCRCSAWTGASHRKGCPLKHVAECSEVHTCAPNLMRGIEQPHAGVGGADVGVDRLLQLHMRPQQACCAAICCAWH